MHTQANTLSVVQPSANQLPMERNQLYMYSSSSFYLTPLSTPHMFLQPSANQNPPTRETSLYTYPPSTPRCGLPWEKKTGLSAASCSKLVSYVWCGRVGGGGGGGGGEDAVGPACCYAQHSLRNMRESQLIQLIRAKLLTQICH